MTKLFLSEIIEPKGYTTTSLSLRTTYICTYQSATHPGDRALIYYYTVQQYHTGSYCKYNQSALLNLSTGDKQNDLVIINTKK